MLISTAIFFTVLGVLAFVFARRWIAIINGIFLLLAIGDLSIFYPGAVARRILKIEYATGKDHGFWEGQRALNEGLFDSRLLIFYLAILIFINGFALSRSSKSR
jgi:hypothetical protein